MKNSVLILISLFLFSCGGVNENKEESNKTQNNISVCACLETKYSELTKMSEKEFDKKCEKLFNDLGVEKALKSTKNCNLHTTK